MKEIFQELRQFTKDLGEERSWLSETFEGSLYSHTPEWLYSLGLKHKNALALDPLNKLKKFIGKKLSPPPSKKIKIEIKEEAPKKLFEGGEKKENPFPEFSLTRLSSEEICITPQVRKRGEIYTQFGISSQNINTEHEPLKVLFLGHLESIPELEGLLGLYQGASGDLLKNMIRAMTLEESEFAYSLFSVEQDFQLSMNPIEVLKDEVMEDLLLEIYNLKPTLVICLGALVTNVVMGKRERLSRIHGEIFSRKIDLPDHETYEFQMMHIFHPEFLQINPNMKRTTWIDLKKALEFIGKS